MRVPDRPPVATACATVSALAPPNRFDVAAEVMLRRLRQRTSICCWNSLCSFTVPVGSARLLASATLTASVVNRRCGPHRHGAMSLMP